MIRSVCLLAVLVVSIGVLGAVTAVAQTATDAERTYLELRRSTDRATQMVAERWHNLTRQQEWNDNTGQFSVQAKYLEHAPDLSWVKLRAVRGRGAERVERDITVPTERLNRQCQSRVRQISVLKERLVELAAAEAERAEEQADGAAGDGEMLDGGRGFVEEPIGEPDEMAGRRDRSGREEMVSEAVPGRRPMIDRGGAPLPEPPPMIVPPLAGTGAESEELPADGEAVELVTEAGTLHGTLLLPTGDGPWPLAVLHAGSGPTDRDGNTPIAGLTNNHLKLLAEALAAQGIASLRFDKRGISQSAAAMTSEEELRFETYVQDTILWANQVRYDPRFSSLFIVGHSEGALIGIMAAQQLMPTGVVSLCGTGVRAGEVLRKQLSELPPSPLSQQGEAIIEQLERGETVDELSPELFILFRPSVQPYMISWLRIDPVEELRKLEIPVLIVSGSTDLQVSPEQAAMLATARDGLAHHAIEGMNHVLKMAGGNLIEQLPSYTNPNLPIAPELVSHVVEFIHTTSAQQDPRMQRR